MKNLPRQLTVLCLAMALAVVMANVALACPNCKDGLAPGGTYSGIAVGFFWSILWMLSVPIMILTGLSTYFYLLVRKARRHRPATTPIEIPNSLPTWEQVMAREASGFVNT